MKASCVELEFVLPLISHSFFGHSPAPSTGYGSCFPLFWISRILYFFLNNNMLSYISLLLCKFSIFLN